MMSLTFIKIIFIFHFLTPLSLKYYVNCPHMCHVNPKTHQSQRLILDHQRIKITYLKK